MLVSALQALLALGSAPTPSLTLVVSFASPGSGVDARAHQRLEQALAASPVKRRTVRWGKEGEFDVCLELTALSAAERATLRQQVQAALVGAQHVTTADRPCPAGR
jgi:hypothetical protein